MHRIRAGAVLAILVLAMAPASRAGTPSCPVGFEEFTEYRLFFGRSRGDVEVVSDQGLAGISRRRDHAAFPRRSDRSGRCRAVARRFGCDHAGEDEAGDCPGQAGCCGGAAHGGDCGGVQTFIRPGGRIAYDEAGLRVVLGLCTLPPRTRRSARARPKRGW